MWTSFLDYLFFTWLGVVLWLDWHLGLFETWLIHFMINNPWYVSLILDWWFLGLEPLYVFLEISRIELFLTNLLSLNLWLEYLLNTFYDSSILCMFITSWTCASCIWIVQELFVWMNLGVLCVSWFHML